MGVRTSQLGPGIPLNKNDSQGFREDPLALELTMPREKSTLFLSTKEILWGRSLNEPRNGRHLRGQSEMAGPGTSTVSKHDYERD